MNKKRCEGCPYAQENCRCLSSKIQKVAPLLNFKDLTHLKGDRNYTKLLFLEEGKSLTWIDDLGDLFGQIEDQEFYRLHLSYVIHMPLVKYYCYRQYYIEVEFENGNRARVSKANYKKFFELLKIYSHITWKQLI